MSDLNANSSPDDEEILVIDGLVANRTFAFTRRSIKHMLIGAGLGFLLSLTLSSILYESARNVMFCVFDIILLLAASVALFLKQEKAVATANKSSSSANDAAASQNLLSFDKPWDKMLAVVRIGGAICMFGAIFAILVIATDIPAAFKMPFVMMISTAHCFLLCLACVEIFNAFFNNGSNLIARQLYTVAFCSIAIGCLSGFMFGAADVENDFGRLRWEEWVTASLCIISGAMIGHSNAYASNDEDMDIAFDPLPMDENMEENNNDENIDPYNTATTFGSGGSSPAAAAASSNNNSNNNNEAPPAQTATTASSSSAATSSVSLATINFPNSSPSLVPKRDGSSGRTNNNDNNNSVPQPDW